MRTVPEMVKNGQTVKFVKYRHNHVYYVTECGFEFPVPTEDLGDATVNATEKAIFLMRYIRKHHALVTENTSQ